MSSRRRAIALGPIVPRQRDGYKVAQREFGGKTAWGFQSPASASAAPCWGNRAVKETRPLMQRYDPPKPGQNPPFYRELPSILFFAGSAARKSEITCRIPLVGRRSGPQPTTILFLRRYSHAYSPLFMNHRY